MKAGQDWEGTSHDEHSTCPNNVVKIKLIENLAHVFAVLSV